jgi:hypothetical protein
MGILTSRVAAEASGLLAWKPPVDVVAVANVASLSGLQTIDGVTGAEGLAVLLTAQSTGAQNGPYLMSAGGWTRRGDMDTSSECVVGSGWRVTRGTLAGRQYWLSGPVGTVITLNTTALTISEVAASGGAGGTLPAGSSMGQLLVWNSSSGLWVPAVNTDGMEPSLYRLSATSGGDFQARAANVSLGFSTSGRIIFADYGFSAKGTARHANVATSDATVTTLLSESLTDLTVHNVLAWICADQAGGTNNAGYLRAATIKRSGGIATLVGGVTAVHTAEDVAGWDATIDVDGANAWRVRVTGAAATNLNWQAFVIFNSVSSGT